MTTPLWLLAAATFLSLYSVLSREAMTEFSLSDMEELLRKRQRTKDLLPRVERFAARLDEYLFSFLVVNFIAKAVAAVAIFDLSSELDSQGLQWTGFISGYMLWLLFFDIPMRPIAEAFAERLVLWLLRSWQLLYGVVFPITLGFSLVYKAMRALVRRGDEESDEDEAEEEIMASLALGELQGQIAETEREMIESILSMGDLTVETVMTPRTDMHAIPVEDGIEGALALARETGHSRLPVYEGNRDNIVGILYAKDLIGVDDEANIELSKIVRKATFVPATKNVGELLAELRKDRVHQVIVLDEYGGTAGLVTFEDLVEVVFGEIADEYDREEEEEIQVVNEHQWDVDARSKVSEVNEKLDLNLPESEGYESLGGLVTSFLGHIPEVGEQWQADGFAVSVTEATERKVVRVRVRREETNLGDDD